MDDAPQQSGLGRLAAYVGVLIGAGYLLNPTAGFIELIPDNLPIIGNLDEAAATALLIYCVQYLRGDKNLPPAPPIVRDQP